MLQHTPEILYCGVSVRMFVTQVTVKEYQKLRCSLFLQLSSIELIPQ